MKTAIQSTFANQHFNILIRWIRSCNRIDQLPICRSLVQTMFVERFRNYLEEVELIQYEAMLQQVITEKENNMQFQGDVFPTFEHRWGAIPLS